MTIEITHSYAEGTLLDGTTREDARKGTEVHAILNRFAWKWMPSIGMSGQRSSRGQLPRQGRIDATRDALEALGYTVEIHIDTTVRDQAEADADNTARLHERADALDAKAERRASEGQAKQQAADEFFAHIPPVSGTTRLSLTRGAVTSTAPALVSTSRGWCDPLRTTSRRPCSSRSPANSAM